MNIFVSGVPYGRSSHTHACTPCLLWLCACTRAPANTRSTFIDELNGRRLLFAESTHFVVVFGHRGSVHLCTRRKRRRQFLRDCLPKKENEKERLAVSAMLLSHFTVTIIIIISPTSLWESRRSMFFCRYCKSLSRARALSSRLHSTSSRPLQCNSKDTNGKHRSGIPFDLPSCPPCHLLKLWISFNTLRLKNDIFHVPFENECMQMWNAFICKCVLRCLWSLSVVFAVRHTHTMVSIRDVTVTRMVLHVCACVCIKVCAIALMLLARTQTEWWKI